MQEITPNQIDGTVQVMCTADEGESVVSSFRLLNDDGANFPSTLSKYLHSFYKETSPTRQEYKDIGFWEELHGIHILRVEAYEDSMWKSTV